MIHTLEHPQLFTEISIIEAPSENVFIRVTDFINENRDVPAVIVEHCLTPRQLHSFIGTLLHVQAKKRERK